MNPVNSCECGLMAFRSTGKFVLMVDTKDKALLSHCWAVSARGRKPNRVRAKIDGKFRSLSHLVHGADAPVVDHENGNPCDNRMRNLRSATRPQNSWNSRKKASYSKYKGITLGNRLGTWRVTLNAANRRIYVGEYRSDVEAARAYDAAALKHHGSFAKTNVMLGLLPPETEQKSHQ